MDLALFKSIIDQIAGKVPAIRLSLRGEATLHKNFVECIQYAKDKGIKEVSTLTHGGTLQLKNFEKMAKAGIDWITVSVDGVGATYDSIRKPLKFNKILDNIKKINEFKIKNNLKRPVIKIQGIWPAISENPEEYYNTFSPYVDLIAFNPLIDYLGNDINIEYLEKFTCPQQYQRLVIGADGLVMKCSNDEENKEVVGDVTKQSVHEIWHGQEMKKIRELHKTDRGFMQSSVCRKCYLPRKTKDEEAEINGRSFFIKNYTFRIQEVGK
jgi:radical SAM protein with 4Fe4S-binding SPASM domain